MKKKIIGMVFTVCLLGTCLVGCEASHSHSVKERQYTENIKQQSLDSVGMPNISNFFEMSQLKDLYELRDDPELICYWYTKNNMSGKWVYEGQCIGYGIPYGSSITSPDVGEHYSNGGTTVTAQAEPNGLYNNGVTTSATWILSVGVDGTIKPRYVEQEISVVMEKIDRTKCEDWSIPIDY